MFDIPHSTPKPKTDHERIVVLEGEIASLKRTVATMTRMLERRAAFDNTQNGLSPVMDLQGAFEE